VQWQTMYGLEDEDPIVKYYDETLALSGESEITWYLEKVKTYGGPVLDLACGTGRIALLLANQGHEVVGIDDSEGMLTIFEKKLQKEPPEIQKRILAQRGKMSDFHLNRKFGTIVCVDAFFHNITVEEEIKCLLCVKDHLKKEGRFLFNIPNPNCEFLLKCASPEGNVFKERKSYVLPKGDTIRIEEAHETNLLNQTIVTKLRYTRVKDGITLESEESWWKTRYLFQYEAVHLLYRCGFEVEDIVGDYENGPVTETSQLIFQATLTP